MGNPLTISVQPLFLPRLEPNSFLIQADDDNARPACLDCLLNSESSGVMLLHLAKVKWLSEAQLSNGILLLSTS